MPLHVLMVELCLPLLAVIVVTVAVNKNHHHYLELVLDFLYFGYVIWIDPNVFGHSWCLL